VIHGVAQVIAEAPKPALQESKSMWGRSRKTVVPAKQLTSVIDGLKEVYFNKVRPAGCTVHARRVDVAARAYCWKDALQDCDRFQSLCVGSNLSWLHIPAKSTGNRHPQVRSLEETFKFGSFFSPMLSESDFDAKPSVLLLGQYSTGAAMCFARICCRNLAGIWQLRCLNRVML